MLRTIFFWALFLPLTLVIILTGLPLSLLSPNYLHLWGRGWGRLSLRLAGIRLTAGGRENLPAGAVIFMANHQSQYDIPALYAGIPGQFRWLAKAELFRIPLFGLAMRRAGYIPVNRSDRREALLSMDRAARLIAGGRSVVVFPEGTRSPDGRLLPLKKGGFMLALKSQVPIVPVAIHGTGRLLPKGSRLLRGGSVRVDILPPIPTAGLGTADRDRLMDEVHRALAAALADDGPKGGDRAPCP
jgi:1-acyl-sn-glycerol-3-phosphate acyltransferase